MESGWNIVNNNLIEYRGMDWLSRAPPRSVHLGSPVRTVEIVMEITMITACLWIPIGNHGKS